MLRLEKPAHKYRECQPLSEWPPIAVLESRTEWEVIEHQQEGSKLDYLLLNFGLVVNAQTQL